MYVLLKVGVSRKKENTVSVNFVIKINCKACISPIVYMGVLHVLCELKNKTIL